MDGNDRQWCQQGINNYMKCSRIYLKSSIEKEQGRSKYFISILLVEYFNVIICTAYVLTKEWASVNSCSSLKGLRSIAGS